MNAKELIEKLQQLPADEDVVVYLNEDGFWKECPVLDVEVGPSKHIELEIKC